MKMTEQEEKEFMEFYDEFFKVSNGIASLRRKLNRTHNDELKVRIENELDKIEKELKTYGGNMSEQQEYNTLKFKKGVTGRRGAVADSDDEDEDDVWSD